MNQASIKETAKKLFETKGEARGVALKTDLEFILKEKGEKGLKQVEDYLKEIGFPIKYKEVKVMNFYPIGLRIISLLAIKEVFNFDDEKIKSIGVFATKVSLIIKLFIKYFFSTQRVFLKEAPKIWDKHYTISKLLPAELNEEKKYAIVKIEDLALDPIFCTYLGGYFCGILKMLIKTQSIDFEETDCPFRGGKYHEFLIKWQ
ncbi:MAG: hypothetical protein ISS83_01360 [Candidatus Pacebacteria bacterium]|nr:hypothetical protein [Candidatus Paceibacterota bacterium]